MKILVIKELSKSFNNKGVLYDINISINRGSVFGLVGQNGAGKTTLIKCILDLLDYEKGKISLFDNLTKNLEIEVKKKIGVLFENNENLFTYLKGTEYLQFIGEIYGLNSFVIKDRINELLRFFNLEDEENKLIEDYSKGMKKKLSIASILLHNPDLIILDEPFEGLDIITSSKIREIILLLKQKGKTIFVTSHILTYLEDIADEIVIIDRGNKIFQSATKDIRNKIKNELTQETYQSLEEIFLDLTASEDDKNKTLSWL